jgi:type II secretory pathway pseudopilin PulG
MAKILALLVMFAVVGIALLVFIINLTLPINSIKSEESATLSNISRMHKKLAQYYLVEDRINHLSNIISQREKLSDVTKALLTEVPSDLSINSMQVDSKSISLIVSGGSLISMNNFIDNIVVLNNKNTLIANVVIQQLSLDVKNNQYSVSIQANIK